MQAFAKTPDCFSMVATLLEPSELQLMRCVSKSLYRGITKDMMIQCIKGTVTRYSRAYSMPDGAIRIYSTFGQRKYDIYKNQDQTIPVYQLNQEGLPVQTFSETTSSNCQELFANKLDNLLSVRSVSLTLAANFTSSSMEMTVLNLLILNVCFKEEEIVQAVLSFSVEIPGTTPVQAISQNIVLFKDIDFYRRRMIKMPPSLLQQLFEARDQIVVLKTTQSALQKQLSNAEHHNTELENAQRSKLHRK